MRPTLIDRPSSSKRIGTTPPAQISRCTVPTESAWPWPSAKALPTPRRMAFRATRARGRSAPCARRSRPRRSRRRPSHHLHERIDRQLLCGARRRLDCLRARLSAGSTNRTPPRRGAVTRSNASVTSAALSGSSRPVMRVMPSGEREEPQSTASRAEPPRDRRPRRVEFVAPRGHAAPPSRVRPRFCGIAPGAAPIDQVVAATSALGSPSPADRAAADATRATVVGTCREASPCIAVPTVDHRARFRPPTSLSGSRPASRPVRAPVRCARPCMPEITIRSPCQLAGDDVPDAASTRRRGSCELDAGVAISSLIGQAPRTLPRSGSRSGSVGHASILAGIERDCYFFVAVEQSPSNDARGKEGTRRELVTRLPYSPAMIARIRSAVSDGVLPTLTPAASRASFFA